MNYQDRVKHQLYGLDSAITDLEKFQTTEKYMLLSSEEMDLIFDQLQSMNNHRTSLKNRITFFEHDSIDKINSRYAYDMLFKSPLTGAELRIDDRIGETPKDEEHNVIYVCSKDGDEVWRHEIHTTEFPAPIKSEPTGMNAAIYNKNTPLA